MRASILVLLGPSGVGKTDTRMRLHRMDPRFTIVPAWTTRSPRVSEIDRVHVSEEAFDQAYSTEEFLPMGVVGGARYATPKGSLRATLGRGDVPLLDWPLALLGQLRRCYAEPMMTVYLRPPTIKELERRLSLDDRDRDGARLRGAVKELEDFDRRGLSSSVDMVVVAGRGRETEIVQAIHTAFLRRCAGLTDLPPAKISGQSRAGSLPDEASGAP